MFGRIVPASAFLAVTTVFVGGLLVPATNGAVSNSTNTLSPFLYTPLPLTAIRPRGWLSSQLHLSAAGLAGHEHDFYRYVSDSTWLGGSTEYSELHESAPYWFNYIVPLAYVLDDARLKAQAKSFLDYVLDHQAEDGWIGPETTRETRGIWARALVLFGMTQYAEADPSETERIVDSMHKFTVLAHDMLASNFTGLIQQSGDNFDPWRFGLARTHELVMSLQWLYENYPRGQEQVIWETMELMFEGGRVGERDWTTFFVEGVFPKVGTPAIMDTRFTHGVNLAQALRYPAVLYRMTKEDGLLTQTRNAVNWTYTYHGSSSGTIIADEHLGGLSPQRGSELCMSVETMFSLSYLYRFQGDNAFADGVERAAFNAFPAAISPDWWSHQYVTQTNQPWSRNLTVKPFYNVVSYGNTFGLEPNFPCCTVNHPQGYPKFLATSFLKAGSNGLIHALLSPSEVTTTLAHGNKVTVSVDTIYPFGDTLVYTITARSSFDFYIRIPSWTVLALSSISVDGKKAGALTPDENSLQKVAVKSGRTTVKVKLGMEVNVVTRGSGGVAVYRGPLLYALDLEYSSESFQPLNWTDTQPLPGEETLPETRDHILETPSEWRIAIDPTNLTVNDNSAGLKMADLPSPIFARGAAPVSITAAACAVAWNVTLDSPALPPLSPACVGERVNVTLSPYGTAKVHMAELPIVGF
ncbi:uncharacterized protein LAJ45_01814 [Morchella importuna]|uniref:uncharacterized protein n=1 Tax=Morchella importuna TaxID=1174673 RepID=UPI001E8DB0AF|nr:uncharacterized protein LAJ45_01814 [Morchella importuna]KAH8154047.1 hypothetical protein LAJ45_01814 [Morchella importuna]